MDFTREPIIETVITPKEGHKLVVRSSKNVGQEEYFVDAIEVVAFGNAVFFRSLERPKAFLAPVSDYEVLEVREARVVLKNVGHDRAIKIGGGREGGAKTLREPEKEEAPVLEERVEGVESIEEEGGEAKPDVRLDKKRDRRRNYRKRRGKEEALETAGPFSEDVSKEISLPVEGVDTSEAVPLAPPISLSSLLQPPPTLISETINRYRQNEQFKGAFYLNEDEQYKPHDKVQELLSEDDEEEIPPHLQEPRFASDEASFASDEPSFGSEEPTHEDVKREEVEVSDRQLPVNDLDNEQQPSSQIEAIEEEVQHLVPTPPVARPLPPPPPLLSPEVMWENNGGSESLSTQEHAEESENKKPESNEEANSPDMHP